MPWYLLILLIIVLLAGLYLLAIMPKMRRRPDYAPFFGRYYAHRGLFDNHSDAPENSLAAFERAVQRGFGIEMDIQLTRDNIPVVVHDFDLRRVCGADVRVRDLSYEELSRYTLFDSQEHIPAFADVLQAVNGRAPLIIEYKLDGLNHRLCEAAAPLLRAYQGLYCIESFHPLPLLWYKKHRPDIVRGFLSTSFERKTFWKNPPLYGAMTAMLTNFLTKPDFIAYNHLHKNNLSRRLCRDLYHALSVAWTIKSETQLAQNQADYDLFIFDSFIPAHPPAGKAAAPDVMKA